MSSPRKDFKQSNERKAFDHISVLDGIPRLMTTDPNIVKGDAFVKYLAQIDRAIAFSDRTTVSQNMANIEYIDKALRDNLNEIRDHETGLLMNGAVFIALLKTRQQRDLACIPAFEKVCQE